MYCPSLRCLQVPSPVAFLYPIVFPWGCQVQQISVENTVRVFSKNEASNYKEYPHNHTQIERKSVV